MSDKNTKTFTWSSNGKQHSISIAKNTYFIILFILAAILLPLALWIGGIILNLIFILVGIVIIALVLYFGFNAISKK